MRAMHAQGLITCCAIVCTRPNPNHIHEDAAGLLSGVLRSEGIWPPMYAMQASCRAFAVSSLGVCLGSLGWALGVEEDSVLLLAVCLLF